MAEIFVVESSWVEEAKASETKVSFASTLSFIQTPSGNIYGDITVHNDNGRVYSKHFNTSVELLTNATKKEILAYVKKPESRGYRFLQNFADVWYEIKSSWTNSENSSFESTLGFLTQDNHICGSITVYKDKELHMFLSFNSKDIPFDASTKSRVLEFVKNTTSDGYDKFASFSTN